MLPKRFTTTLGLAAVVLLGLSSPAALAQNTTYLALGDSVAYGRTATYDPATTLSNGDQGYVSLFADYLDSRNGGAPRPNVINLAISGETSLSYLTGLAPAGPQFREPLTNTNYVNDTTAQIALAHQRILAEQAAGRTITHVTFAVGANDFLYLALNPAFQGATPAVQQTMVLQTFNTVATTYFAALSDIRTLLPNAQLLLPDYYNPFGAFTNPADPRFGANVLFTNVALGFQNLLAGVAPVFNGNVVDIYQPFLGHETDYTYILTGTPQLPGGDVHPTPLGYSVIAQRLSQVSAAADVPEPGTLALLVAGLTIPAAPGIVKRRRR